MSSGGPFFFPPGPGSRPAGPTQMSSPIGGKGGGLGGLQGGNTLNQLSGGGTGLGVQLGQFGQAAPSGGPQGIAASDMPTELGPGNASPFAAGLGLGGK
jgi:hypothetical protein